MKKVLIIICITMSVAGLHAQEFKIKPDGTLAEITVSIQNLYGDIKVIGTNEGEVRIVSDGYEGIPEKAQGLKPLSATGPENTGVGLFVKEEGGQLIIAGAHRRADDASYEIYLPKNMKLKIDYNSFQAEDVAVSGMANEVEIRSQVGDLVIESVTGPIVANTLSGDIEVIFSELAQGSPTSISSTSGDLDITLPASSKGTFAMSSMSGEVYTDLNFEMDEEGDMKRVGGGMSLEANLNGGGVEVSLKCLSGDIFIRKQ
ncbi:MAG: DUF4097 family beta strand repeat protein [Cyclobacteriaceae bacterium]